MNLKKWMIFLIGQVLIIIAVFYYVDFLKPKNSIELYQSLAMAEDFEEAKQFMLKGYEDRLNEDDVQYISNLENPPNQISQFSLFEYNDKTYVLITAPGEQKLEVLNIEELPEEIRTYFLEMGKGVK